MATTWLGGPIAFRVAGTDEIGVVLDVLDEAAGWLQARGIGQWPSRFEADWVAEAIARRETSLVLIGDQVAGTLTLDWTDPLWSDVGGSAGYLHRMAVRRWARGLGTVVLDWAAGAVRRQGRGALRLDCVAANKRLRAYYEAAGFGHRGDVTVYGAPGQRHDDGPGTVVSRYERSLAG